MSTAAVESKLPRGARIVGRKPSKNPLSTLISFRLDTAQTAQLDAELERELAEKPGLLLSRGDIVRVLMLEAITARAQRRGSKKK